MRICICSGPVVETMSLASTAALISISKRNFTLNAFPRLCLIFCACNLVNFEKNFLHRARARASVCARNIFVIIKENNKSVKKLFLGFSFVGRM